MVDPIKSVGVSNISYILERKGKVWIHLDKKKHKDQKSFLKFNYR